MPWHKNKGGGYSTRKGGNVANPRQYEALRRKGISKANAARIVNSRKRRKRKG